MPGPLSGQLLVSAIGVVVGGRNQIGKAQVQHGYGEAALSRTELLLFSLVWLNTGLSNQVK